MVIVMIQKEEQQQVDAITNVPTIDILSFTIIIIIIIIIIIVVSSNLSRLIDTGNAVCGALLLRQ